MTRIGTDENGQYVLKSFSYWGPGGEEEAEAEYRRTLENIKKLNEERNEAKRGQPPPLAEA